MTLEIANVILRATSEMTGTEIALLELIKDLQVRHVANIGRIDELCQRIEKLEEGTGNWKDRR